MKTIKFTNGREMDLDTFLVWADLAMRLQNLLNAKLVAGCHMTQAFAAIRKWHAIRWDEQDASNVKDIVETYEANNGGKAPNPWEK